MERLHSDQCDRVIGDREKHLRLIAACGRGRMFRGEDGSRTFCRRCCARDQALKTIWNDVKGYDV